MVRKIVMFRGGVETLDFFGKQMGMEFERQGISVFYFNLEDAKNEAKKVGKFIRSGETVMLTFNFEALEREEYIYQEQKGYIWQGYDLPIYNIIVDHPYYYHDRLMDLEEDDRNRPGLLAQYHHISIDRFHQRYFKRFYPKFKEAGFLPLAGTDSMPGIELPPIDTRSNDIIFTGNYTEPEFFESYAHHLNEEYAAFYHGMMDELVANPWKTVEEVELSHCYREMGVQKDEDMRLPMHKMIFIDLYVRNYFRGEVIRTLVDNGFSIKVIGAGWEKLKVRQPNRMQIMGQTDSLTCLNEIRNSKVSVNVMPWFRDGAHDRVFNSILNGAVCFTDESKYQKEVLPEGCGVSYYVLGDENEICSKMEKMLCNDKSLEELLQGGIEQVRNHHTWANRTQRLLEIMVTEK